MRRKRKRESKNTKLVAQDFIEFNIKQCQPEIQNYQPHTRPKKPTRPKLKPDTMSSLRELQ